MRVGRTTRMLAALLFACQCGAAAPVLTSGAVAQTTEALYLQPKRGDAVIRVDKATSAQTPASPPIARTVSAIDVDGEMLYVGTKTTQLSGGWFPIYDGFGENFIASIDNTGVLTTLLDHRSDISAVAHDAAYLYWTEHGVRWRRLRSGGTVTQVPAADETMPALRLPLPRVSPSGSVTDEPAFTAGSWIVFDETVWYDPHVSAKARYAMNLCDSAPPMKIYSAGYRTTPPRDPIPESPPMAVDACGIFVSTERMICFAPQSQRIDELEIYLAGLARSPALRSGGGDVVVIKGSGFDATTVVDIDGQPAPLIASSENALSVTTPPLAPSKKAVSVPLRVRNGAGDCTMDLITLSDPRRRAAGR